MYTQLNFVLFYTERRKFHEKMGNPVYTDLSL